MVASSHYINHRSYSFFYISCNEEYTLLQNNLDQSTGDFAMTWGLALSGGGARGAYTAGAQRYLFTELPKN